MMVRRKKSNKKAGRGEGQGGALEDALFGGDESYGEKVRGGSERLRTS